MLMWTAAMGTWFALVVGDRPIRPGALVMAVGALFGVIWLLGLLILGLFLVGGE